MCEKILRQKANGSDSLLLLLLLLLQQLLLQKI